MNIRKEPVQEKISHWLDKIKKLKLGAGAIIESDITKDRILPIREEEAYPLPQPSLYGEALVREEIGETLKRLERCRSNFFYAEREYVDIAVVELYNEEVKLGVLLKKLKLLQMTTGEVAGNQGATFFPTREHLPWLKQKVRQSAT